MRGLFLVLFLLTNIYGFSFEISNPEIKNGQTALIKFSQEKGVEYKYITIKDKKKIIFTDYVFVPVSYYEEPKNLEITVFYTKDNENRTKKISLKVIDGKYEKEVLNVDSSKVKLSEEDKKRAAKEYVEAMDIYNSTTEKSYLDSKFLMPMDSKITSDFGRARVFNGTLKSYHSGTDFRAKVGTQIQCVNDGKVVLVKDRFYSGGSIIVDHGHGIYTCYYHMSKFDVKKDEVVKKGQVLGLSGASGRVTGPHLHFSARVSGIQVDPLQFIELINKEL
ncbi:MAG: M23 family metallopeptidase [Thiovulaceae bacterium]|nr:M23 family metallopeptidase [Sulfurimonadaceae bacterium]